MKNPLTFRREPNHKNTGTPQKQPLPTYPMSGSEGGGGPNPRAPLGLSLEQARELGRGHAIQQLQ